MTKHEQATTIRELSDAEIDVVSGGSKVGQETLHGAIVGHDSLVAVARQVAFETGIMYGSH